MSVFGIIANALLVLIILYLIWGNMPDNRPTFDPHKMVEGILLDVLRSEVVQDSVSVRMQAQLVYLEFVNRYGLSDEWGETIVDAVMARWEPETDQSNLEDLFA